MPAYTDDEKRLIHWLATKYTERGTELAWRSVLLDAGIDGYDERETCEVVFRFCRYGLLQFASNETVRIRPAVLNAKHELDHPPLRDYWEEMTRWFRSKKWSLPLLAVVVGLPAIVTWIEMLRTILTYLFPLPS